MRRKSQKKQSGTSVERGNTIRNTTERTQDTITHHYETTEIMLCRSCLFRRRFKSFVTSTLVIGVIGSAAFWYSTRTQTNISKYDGGTEETSTDGVNPENHLVAPLLVDDQNSKFRVRYNVNGAVLSSSTDVLYLGKTCEASSNKWGNGIWHNDNATLVVLLEKQKFSFQNAELNLDCTNDEGVTDTKSDLQLFEAKDYRNQNSANGNIDAAEFAERAEIDRSDRNRRQNSSSSPLPKGNLATWVTNSDYPSAALKWKYEGTVSYQLDVGENGRVMGCSVTGTSGHPELDEATCALLTRRGRFEPALDEDGKATSGTYSNRVSWSMP